jgi:hypothetical protein
MARLSPSELDQAANSCRHRLDSANAHIAAAGNAGINHFIGLVEAAKAEGKAEDILFSSDEISQNDRKRFVSLHSEARSVIELFFKTFKAFPINLANGTKVGAALLNDDALKPFIDQNGYDDLDDGRKNRRGRPRGAASKRSITAPKKPKKLVAKPTGKKRGRPRKYPLPEPPTAEKPHQRLTEDAVREIKAYLAEIGDKANGSDDRFLANRHHVTPSAIYQIRKRLTHKGPYPFDGLEEDETEETPDIGADDMREYLESQSHADQSPEPR